jgi:DNA-directed RNA polymerase specialized sigma subunit
MPTDLEPVEEAYTRWATDPTPDNMSLVVSALNPTLNSEVQRYKGPKPILKTQAKKLAIKAVKSYDPASPARLRSWVVTNLQPLNRYGRSISSPMHASELAVRQAAEMETTRKRLVDELGDNPTDEQLADEVGISVIRVRRLRELVRPVASEQAFASEEGGEVYDVAVKEMGTDPTLRTAQEMVHASLDDRDKRIMELKTGFGGKQPVDNMTIAKRLGVSPAFVSQRSAKISQMILDTMGRV